MPTRDTLKQFLSDVYEIEGDRISIGADPTQGGDSDSLDFWPGTSAADDLGIEPITEKQLLELDDGSTEGMMARYLYYLAKEYDHVINETIERKNVNPYAPGKADTKSSSAYKGAVLPAAEGDSGQNDVFIPSNHETLGAIMSKHSQSDYITGGEEDFLVIDALKIDGGKDAHELLSSVEGSPINRTGDTVVNTGGTLLGEDGSATRVITAALNNMLISNNRFAPSDSDTVYVEKTETASDLEASNHTMLQSSFGYHATSEAELQPDGTTLSVAVEIDDKLRKLGSSLLLSAAGWDSNDMPGEKIDPAEFLNSLTEGETDVAEIIANYGTEISTHENLRKDGQVIESKPSGPMRPRNAYGVPQSPDGTGASIRSGRDEYLTFEGEEPEGEESQYSHKSYGSTYNSDIPFDQNSSVLIAQAAAAMTILQEQVSTIAGGILDVFKAEGADDRTFDQLGRGPFFKGESSADLPEVFSIMKRLIAVPTFYPYGTCLDVGWRVLFKIPGGDTVSEQVSSISKAIYTSETLYDSPGFWLAIARSILMNASKMNEMLADLSSGGFGEETFFKYIRTVSKSRIVGFSNMIASIGDMRLKSSGGAASRTYNSGFFDVDLLPDGPGTRHMKSRSNDGLTTSALAWRGNAMPSIYVCPTPVIAAASRMGSQMAGPNPARGHLGSDLVKKTWFVNTNQGDSAITGQNPFRIPNDVIERLENALDAEYVPFYFHDLRTNEIVAFPAFLETLTDTFTPSWTPVQGYGRMDPVQIYKGTTRSLGLSFTIAATSKADFDEMWWKINKLTTLLYPQWTQGQRIQVLHEEKAGKSSTFTQPFSQVIGASPVIRLRVGDVIKSNYSKFNLARMFGIGDEETKIVDPNMNGFAEGFLDAERAVEKIMQEVWYGLFGSPLGLGAQAQRDGSAGPKGAAGIKLLRSAASMLLTNGFANPIGVNYAHHRLEDPDSVTNPTRAGSNLSAIAADLMSTLKIGSLHPNKAGFHNLDTVIIKASEGGQYYQSPDGQRWHLARPLRALVKGRKTQTFVGSDHKGYLSRTNSHQATQQKTYYEVQITDFGAPQDLFMKKFLVTHSDVHASPESIFAQILPVMNPLGFVRGILTQVATEAAAASGLPADAITDLIGGVPEINFMSAYGDEGNPVVKSFNSTKGRGLAGVITSMNFSWISDEQTWDLDWNARAPKMCRVTLGFSPIHDLPPGLDYTGYNRAPIYNVGEIMKGFGDPYDDNGVGSKTDYTSAARGAHIQVGEKLKLGGLKKDD